MSNQTKYVQNIEGQEKNANVTIRIVEREQIKIMTARRTPTYKE